MSTLVSIATGNFTAAATWGLCDPTSELDSNSNQTNSTTSFVASANFVPGALTANAIAVKINSRSTTLGGTYTVELFNSTGALSVAQVTVNVTDLPTNGGWVFFPFTATLLLAATNYQIRVKSSVNASVSTYRNATAGNWSRQLRTTTTQAPAASDKLIIVGEHTGAGTGNNFTVTMNSTATTTYGTVAFPESLSIGKRGTLAYGVTAATNYYLRVKGQLWVFDGGSLTIGTSGSPMPSTSTAVLEFDATANVDSGLTVANGANFESFGNALTYDRAKLTADAAAAATSLTTDVSTGWLTGDEIGIASTSRTETDTEKKSLTANAAGTTLTIAALTSAHTGALAATAAELINLTRNIKIRGISSVLCGFIYSLPTATFSSSWTEFTQLGSVTAKKRGISFDTTTGSFTLNRCALHDYFQTANNAIGTNTNAASGWSNATITNNVFMKTGYVSVYLATATTGTWTCTGNISMGGSAIAVYGFILGDVGGMFDNNVAVGHPQYGINLTETGGVIGSCTGNLAHANSYGFFVTGVSGGSIGTNTSYYNNVSGFYMSLSSNITTTSLSLFGNTNSNIYILSNADCRLSGVSALGSLTYATSMGIQCSGTNRNVMFASSNFGAIFPHTLADIHYSSEANELIFHNTSFYSTNEINTAALGWILGSLYRSQRHQGVAGSHKVVWYQGIETNDTVITNGSGHSVRLTPSQAAMKLTGGIFRTALASGSTTTVSVYLRRSVVGDGAAYNGNQPRLMLRANPAAGIATDAVIATASAAAGTWAQISGTTAAVTDNAILEFYVDCDGTTGWVNVDDWDSTQEPDTRGLDYFQNGGGWARAITNESFLYTDPGIANVRLSTAYKFNSTTNNRTGNVTIPSVANVKTGVTFDTLLSLTGTYDGSDRWTDPGDNNVRLGVAYKANSTSNNKTGRVTVPIAAQVKIGTAFETDAGTTGTYDGSDRWTDPGQTNVLLGTTYKANSLTNNRTGTVTLPSVANVKIGVTFGDALSLTGTYDGSDRWSDPGIANVRLGVTYKANSTSDNRIGDVTIPAIGQVKIGVTYDSLLSLTGTYDGSDRWTDPGIANVRLGASYKANSLTNNRTGDVTIPATSEVKIGTTFDSLLSLTGTYDGSERYTDVPVVYVSDSYSWAYNSLTNNRTGTSTALSTGSIVEGTLTIRDSLRLILASSAGKVSGANTTVVTIRDTTDTKDRITATVDEFGNRTSVSYDAS